MPFVLANVLQPLIDATDAVLVFLHAHVVAGSWGLAIIALTVIVRMILLPLTLKQFRSMQALQRLQPQIKELQAKYKDDRQRLNQEMMKFYQENKVNPFSSCLPLVAQMPIFLALFYMLRTDLKHDICPGIKEYVTSHPGATIANTSCDKVDPGSANFLFISDLTHQAGGAVLITLIVLYVASQLVSSLLMSVSADKNQRRLIVLLPLVFVTFVAQFPAGLIVYWITTNCWTILQQYIVKRTVGPLKPPAGPPGAPADAPAPKPELATAGASGGGRSAAPPPPPPRKRSRKRSGRRR